MKIRPLIVIRLFIISVLLITLVTSCKKSDENDPTIIKDGDGNTYTSVTIGTQVWLVENLKTTKLNDGTPIPLVTDQTAWNNLKTIGYCWYDNNETEYKSDYGALYNWYVANNDKICPKGWHVPTDAEWTSLLTFLGNAEAGAKLKEMGTTHWDDPNPANNQSGFKAFGGGYRGQDFFGDIRISGYWWSSTELSSSHANSLWLVYSVTSSGWADNYKYSGLSVRCIKD